MQKFDYYTSQARDLIKDDKERNEMFDNMNAMYRNLWTLPANLANLQWIHKVIDTGPHDALNAAGRVLSTVEPKITYYPLDNHPETRARCNEIEKALAWHYKRASRRSVGSITRDIIMSALKYDEIAAQVIYLPWQRKISEQLKSKMFNTSGDFAIVVHNPRDVHVKRSVYGVEAVLLCRQMTAEDVTAMWGDAGSKAIEKIADAKTDKATNISDGDDEYTYYDWTDSVNRVVWIGTEEEYDTRQTCSGEIVYQDAHGLKFLPWVSRLGGTSLDCEPEYQRHPLLASVYQAGQWETINMLKTLEMSKAIATAAAPMSKTKSSNGQAPEIDYTTPGGNVETDPTSDYTPLPPPQLDPRMRELTAQMSQAIGGSTVPRILQSAEFPSGAAFSSLNTMLRSASAVLDPFRTTAQLALADIFTQMLLWIVESKSPLYAYETASKKNIGANLEVKWDEISPDDIYIDVELSANLPLDKMSEINAAIMLVQQLGMAKEAALELLDYTNAQEVIEQGVQEAFVQAEIQNRLKLKGAKADLEIQKMQQKQQMEMQQEQMAAQQAQQQPPQPGGPSPEGMAAQAEQQQGAQAAAGMTPEQQMQAFGQVFGQGGPGMNPAAGGSSPAMMAPGITKEVINQRAQNGEPTAMV